MLLLYGQPLKVLEAIFRQLQIEHGAVPEDSALLDQENQGLVHQLGADARLLTIPLLNRYRGADGETRGEPDIDLIIELREVGRRQPAVARAGRPVRCRAQHRTVAATVGGVELVRRAVQCLLREATAAAIAPVWVPSGAAEPRRRRPGSEDVSAEPPAGDETAAEHSMRAKLAQRRNSRPRRRQSPQDGVADRPKRRPPT